MRVFSQLLWKMSLILFKVYNFWCQENVLLTNSYRKFDLLEKALLQIGAGPCVGLEFLAQSMLVPGSQYLVCYLVLYFHLTFINCLKYRIHVEKDVSLGPVLTGSFSSFSQNAEFHYDSENSKTAYLLRLEITTHLFFFSWWFSTNISPHKISEYDMDK